MIKWLEIDKGSIFRDKKRDGLLVNFLRDYKTEFGGSINPSCIHCLERYYSNFIKKYTMSTKENECKFVLKLKYNGIHLGANGQPRRNGEMTTEQAIELLEKHPHGKLLFDEIPDSYYSDLEVVAEIVKEETKQKTAKKPTKKNNK